MMNQLQLVRACSRRLRECQRHVQKRLILCTIATHPFTKAKYTIKLASWTIVVVV